MESVKTKLIFVLMLISFTVVITGCTVAVAERIARRTATNDFYKYMKVHIMEADEIRIYLREFAHNSNETDKLVYENSYTKNDDQREFINLLKGFKRASQWGVGVNSVPEKKIVFLSKGEIIYELNYCIGDRRITDGIERNGFRAILFLPKSTDRYLK
ncbi:MAG: hypothetical protein SCK29_01810 [Bacillota bacterium]|nr:hypothetical protein [Bacillota bacterium]MDW7682837.1 hypothetical protein [Bacillota bacterium]